MLASIGEHFLPRDKGVSSDDASVFDAFWYHPRIGMCAPGPENSGSGDGSEASDPGSQLALFADTDAIVLTLIIVSNSVDALECRDASTGLWHDVPLGPGKCAVIVGRSASK